MHTMTSHTILIHGGLNRLKRFEEDRIRYQQSLKRIVESGYVFLQKHSALETAVFATKLLEDDPLLNAGTGSAIQSDGFIRMSASLMDGEKINFSGVMNIEHIQNPVALAMLLQNEKDRVLAGSQALKYARNNGFAEYNPETAHRQADYEHKAPSEVKPSGTVGCVVLDGDGRLAAATSTGGKGYEIPGRVGDSPTIAGNFANNYCAVSATGCGEDIINAGLASALATRVTDGMPLQQAGEKALADLKRVDGSAGFIALDNKGATIMHSSHPHLTWAKADGNGIMVFE